MEAHVINLADDITKITEAVWTSTLNESIIRKRLPDNALSRPFLTTCIHITGAWEGTMILECSLEYGRAVAASIFGTRPADVTHDEAHDAVGELINMIGGNVKALLPTPSQLSLPSVAEGMNYRMSIPGTVALHELDYDSNGHWIRVRLLQSTRRRD